MARKLTEDQIRERAIRVKDTGRMKRCLEAHIKYYQEQADYYNRTATGLQEDLDNFDEENPDNNYIPCDKNVWWE